MTQITHYDIGDVWRPQADFTVSGVAADPTVITYRIEDPAGTITTASATAASLTTASTPLARTTTGSFILSWPLDLAGNWYARFEGTGAVTAAQEWEAICDPSVFYSSAGLSVTALVGLGETKEWMGETTQDGKRDRRIIQCINAASRRIQSVAGREFKAASSAVAARSFDIYWSDCYGTKMIGDLASTASVTATITTIDSVAVQTLVSTDYVVMPRRRESWQPITSLRFLKTASGYKEGNVLNISGVWGFPAVPEDIRHACMDTVAFWMDRDVEHFRQDLGAIPGGSEGGQTVILGGTPTILPLPPEAFSIAKDYRHHMVV